MDLSRPIAPPFSMNLWRWVAAPDMTLSFRRKKELLPLDSSGACLDRAQAFQVKFGPPIKCIDAVLLLVDIGQLRVAVAEHAGMVKQRGAQSFKALVEFLKGLWGRAIAPTGRSVARTALGIPPDAAEFADHVGLVAVGERDRAALMIVDKRLAFCRMRMCSGKDRRVLLIIVAIIHIGFWHAVAVAGSIQHWPRLVERFCGQKQRTGHIIEHGNVIGERLPGFV